MKHANRILSVGFALAIGGSCCAAVATASETDVSEPEATGQRCSNRSMLGTYLFEYIASPAGSDPLDISVGFRYFDGEGVGRLFYTGLDGQDRTEPFRYNVERDCTGTVDYTPGTTSERMFVHPQGINVAWIDTRPGFVAVGHDWRSSKRAPRQCSNATLKGTYSYTSRGGTGAGITSRFGEAGLESFDGRGMLWNRYTDSNGEDGVVTGRYRIGSNCMGRVTYASGEDYRVYVGPTGEGLVGIDLSDDFGRFGSEYKISDKMLVTDD